MAFGVLPPGVLLGGAVVSATGNVALVYVGAGVSLLLIGMIFAVPILAHAKRLRLGEYADQPLHALTVSESLPTEEAREGEKVAEGEGHLV